MNSKKRNFCAAPWVEGVLHSNGSFYICCRNLTVFGNWQKEGLKKIWNSELLQKFRRDISEGKFPDDSCKRCYHNGTSRSLYQELTSSFQINKTIVFDFLEKQIPEIAKIENLFNLRELSTEAEKSLEEYFFVIENLKKQIKVFQPSKIKSIIEHISPRNNTSKRNRKFSFAEYKLALIKLKKIGLILIAYLEKDLTPPVVAPFRQVNLISKCNIRCIHCPFKYGKGIITGPELDKKYVDDAFSYADDIIDFFMYGSEFLFYKDWKKIAIKLINTGTKLSISTNGVLLTKQNIQYLIDNRIVKNINISMDGATKKTVESIRLNVNFDKLIKSIDFLFSYASEQEYNFSLSFSFVLMKRNYQEFPMLISFINNIRGDRKLPFVSAYCQALENFDFQEYKDFVNKEHHSLIDKKDLTETFKQVLLESQNSGIPVGAFYSYKIEDFAHQDFPFPPLLL